MNIQKSKLIDVEYNATLDSALSYTIQLQDIKSKREMLEEEIDMKRKQLKAMNTKFELLFNNQQKELMRLKSLR